MDPIDLSLSVLCLSIVVVGGTAAFLLRRFTAHYLEAGALGSDTLTPGTPCTFEFPEGGALDLMLRFTTEKSRGQQEGLTALLQVERAGPGDVGSVMAVRYARGLTLHAQQPADWAFQPSTGMSYAFKKMGRESTRSVVVPQTPAGGRGRVTADMRASPGTNVTYVVCFVKPARTALFS